MQSYVDTPSHPDIASSRLRWRRLESHTQQPLARAAAWLRSQGSLTQQLLQQSDNQFRVEVVSEDWILVKASDLARHFGPVAPSQRFWSRKVLLFGKEQAWVAAHTLIPEHSLYSPLRELLELNTRPLGEYLFSHPELLRAEMDFAPLDGAWGRRSLFFLHRKPIMVAEFFLPALLAELD
jgi:chorismate--pyruvate lyase